MSSQILRGANDVDSDFAVVPVNKSNIAQVIKWPGRAQPGTSWINHKRGPSSALLKAGDKISVAIFDSAENSLLVPRGHTQSALDGLVVSAAGTVFIPYVGDVVINGQSVDQARRNIETQVQTVAPTAQIVLTSTSGVQNSVDLVSGMIRPGTYPLADGNQTVLAMIAAGGGIAPGLRNPAVRLIRDGKTYEVSAKRLLEDGSLDTVVRGGDKITVGQDERYFTSLGATGTERLIYFEKDTISALEAMSIAGGLLDGRADPKGVLILREYSAKHLSANGDGPSKTKVIFSFDLTTADALFAARSFPVIPGDTILVSESPLPVTQSIMSIFGTAVGIGNTLNNIAN